MNIEKHFFNEGIDGDTNLRMVSQNAMLNCMNARMSISKTGRLFRLENIPGTTQISQSVYPPYGENQFIGGCQDPARDRIVYALYNTHGFHGIYCLDLSDVNNPVTYAVLYDTQVVNGLNFSKSYRIDRDCFVVNGLFYWVEGTNNQPRQINIDSGIKANHSSYSTTAQPYYFPIENENILIIKQPPQLAPNFIKDTDVDFENNFIYNQSYQFVFMQTGYDGYETVLGTYSPSTRLNNPDDTENYIIVSMDVNQQIPQTTKIVSLCVRVGNGVPTGSNIVYVVKTWDKSITDERNEIIEQNNGTATLTFNYYGNIDGKAIAKDYVYKNADKVPVYSKTATSARNRCFLANNTEGYDTPTQTSLSLSTISTPIVGSTIRKQLIGVSISFLLPLPGRGYSAWYVYLNSAEVPAGFQAGYYELTTTVQTNNSSIPPSLGTAPTFYGFASSNRRGGTQSEVIAYVKSLLGASGSTVVSAFNILTDPIAGYVTVTGIIVSRYNVFKSGARYKYGIVFFDFAMRKCGVLTNDGMFFEVPPRTFTNTTIVTQAVWSLSNTDALTEIPDWAYYYAIVFTLNLTTRFFIQGFTNAAKYATKNQEGQWQFTNSTFVGNTLGIGLNTSALIQAGLGYTFSEGDVCVLTENGGNQYELPVIGQDGNYIIIQAENLGDIGNDQFIFEIYTPYKTSEQEPYWEIGQLYRVLDYGTSSRTYETTSDIVVPDAYLFTRTFTNWDYLAEAMSPDDRYYRRWDTDAGKPNFITQLGRVSKQNFGSYSNTYIPGTQLNGLNTFEPLSEFNVPESSGEINKIVLTQKIQDKGTVMLAICKHETNSVYLGEEQISGSQGQTSFFAKSGGVVGTINSLKGSFGTINKETVFEYLGVVFWLDVLNGTVVQYSQAGLEPVSRYKMNRFFQNYCEAYLAASTGNLDNINGFHHIPSCIDPFSKECLFTLPALIYSNYANTLPSFTSVPSYASSIIDRFDVYDQLGKTMAYKYLENNWGNNYEFMPEGFEYFGNMLFAFKNGVVYKHNSDIQNWNNFYGTEYPVRICISANVNPSALKNLCNIAIESNLAPSFTVAMANYPNEQITSLSGSRYKDEQGFFYAVFLLDRLSPNSSGTPDEKMFKRTSDTITDVAVSVMTEFWAYDELFWINFVNIGWETSKGQKKILNPINT